MTTIEIILLSTLGSMIVGFMLTYLFITPYLKLRKSQKKLKNITHWIWLHKLGLLDFAEIMNYDRKYPKFKWYK